MDYGNGLMVVEKKTVVINEINILLFADVFTFCPIFTKDCRKS